MAKDKSTGSGKDAAKAGRANRERHTSDAYSHRLRRMRDQGLKPPIAQFGREVEMKPEFALDCGWGRLVFAQTFDSATKMIAALSAEQPDRRDIAVYVRDPHVLLANAPQELFLDPSHMFRLDLSRYRPSQKTPKGFFIRRLTSQSDAEAINRIYATRSMVPVPPDFFWATRDARTIVYFVAEDEQTGEVLGTVTGVDHVRAFGDSERGSSLWCLAIDPVARHPGIGEALVRRLAEYFTTRGAAFLDLSVLHDNKQAIALYEKLGFQRVSFFSVKRKNPINETLFTGPDTDAALNPYAKIIVSEARRRGIHVQIVDAEGGFFRLTYGGRSILCRESLSDLTSAVAMSICDDKSVTRRIVSAAGVRVPAQLDASARPDEIAEFVKRCGSVVVKPARGEQGRGISIDIHDPEEIRAAIEKARSVSDTVLLEEYVKGDDLRLVVINYRVVAAAIRRPPAVVGNGVATVRELIAAQSRRRSAATGGEAKIPLDAETERTVRGAGYELDGVLPAEEQIAVRKTANLHTGGTIHDVTDSVNVTLLDAAVAAARAIDIPVTGIDFLVQSPRRPDYVFIEANERPGLANHEPQPTAERFVDLLFPLSVPASVRQNRQK
ncbi:N-acetylglutaminylglutamine synthetase [Oricola cellulosilytica]|uniref:N-acetylglutaminylglutamine synthetase n=1 Tax=Oricola cellulosilytica TaxID=1429082 RepID=A0A4R0PE75_9HYPH|nr:N-acetylglutaminylglutamine synthetase [Oricola cellulosilytica]TCD13673.1 N-acetylglutaminylglutamine synthetase [Oricola cellulosilytica]